MDKRQGAGNIKVFCRFRPFNQQELDNNPQKMHRFGAKSQLIIKGLKDDEQTYMFDKVFDMDSTQQSVYKEVGKPVLNNILDGFNGTIMAYGQTSSGKTHTMQGYDLSDRQLKGIMPRIIQQLFQWIEKSPDVMEFKLKISIFELYMEKVRDLLDVGKTDLKVRENKDGPYVQDITEVYVGQRVQLFKLIQLGQKNRIVCATNMNASSSRSHMIFLLTLNQVNTVDSSSKTSKLFLIDLAGSEKISKTGAEGKVLEEAKKINLSLTSLGKVIKALSEKAQKPHAHVPYRDSKLTRIIKDSLGGNSKTTLIVTCSPHQIHLAETISTLRFGQNAQKIKNKPKINKQLTVAQLQKIVEKLEGQIQKDKSWIKVLEEYIKNTLHAELPSKETKIQEATKQILKQQEIQQNNEIQQAEQHKAQQVKQHIIENVELQAMQKQYQDRIKCLETQISNSHITLKKQMDKFYELKKQYNSIYEDMKNLIKENLVLQEKLKVIKALQEQRIQKQNRQAKQSQDNKIIRKPNQQQQNILKYLLGDLLHILQQYTSSNALPEQLLKQFKLVSNLDNIIQNSLDIRKFWNDQRKKIQQRLKQPRNQAVAETLIKVNQQTQICESTKEEINLQNILRQHQKKILERQNKKLQILQSKIDKLYSEYHEMITLQTTWKVQCQLYQRKLKQKEEKIMSLQDMIEELSQQLQMMDNESDMVSVKTKIIKPMKGGGAFRF